MSIFDRIRRITAANVGAALDKVEDPEKLLKQRVRELEDTVADARRSMSEFALTLKKTEREDEQLKRLRDEWQHKAETSLRVGDEEMARRSLGEKVNAEDRLAEMAPSLVRSKETYARLRTGMTALQDQLRQATLKLSELRTRKTAAQAQKSFSTTLDKAAGHVSSGENDMARMEEQVLQAESEAEIDAEIRGDLTDAVSRTEKKSAEFRLDAELDALKKKIGK
jgi:phage shock protein A